MCLITYSLQSYMISVKSTIIVITTPHMDNFLDQTKSGEREKLLVPNVNSEYRSIDTGTQSSTPVRKRGFTVIEPVMFLFVVGQSLSDTIITNMLEYQACKAQLRLSDENCTDPMAAEVENLIQPTTANVIMVRNVIEAFFPSILALLIGPWSDANGRKPFLVVTLSGMAVSYFCWGYLSLQPYLYPSIFPLASLALSFTGGPCVTHLLVYCYTADVTNEHTRPIRMAVLGLIINVSTIIGMVLAPVLVVKQNSVNPYPAVFFTSSTLLLVATMYTIWGIQESVEVRPERERRFFLTSHIKSLVSVCFKRREGCARVMIHLIILTLTVQCFLFAGESAVLYLSTRKMFSWQLQDLSNYGAFTSICYGLGTLIGVWFFSTLLGLPNMLATTILLLTRVPRCIIMALSRSGQDFYLAVLVSSMFISFSPLCRTELSKLIPRQDLGKVYALAAFLEFMTPIAAAPIYTYIYEVTFLDFPTTVFWLSTSISIFSVIVCLIIVVLQQCVKGACYVPLESSSDPD